MKLMDLSVPVPLYPVPAKCSSLPASLHPSVVGQPHELEPMFNFLLKFVQSRTLTQVGRWEEVRGLDWEKEYFSNNYRTRQNWYYFELALLMDFYDIIFPMCDNDNYSSSEALSSEIQDPLWDTYLNTVILFCSLHHGQFMTLTKSEIELAYKWYTCSSWEGASVRDGIRAVLESIDQRA